MRLVRQIRECLLDAPTLSFVDIAAKHGVDPSEIEAQLKIGMSVEKEHTSDEKAAREIALDHLGEAPDYYDRLSAANL